MTMLIDPGRSDYRPILRQSTESTDRRNSLPGATQHVIEHRIPTIPHRTFQKVLCRVAREDALSRRRIDLDNRGFRPGWWQLSLRTLCGGPAVKPRRHVAHRDFRGIGEACSDKRDLPRDAVEQNQRLRV